MSFLSLLQCRSFDQRGVKYTELGYLRFSTESPLISETIGCKQDQIKDEDRNNNYQDLDRCLQDQDQDQDQSNKTKSKSKTTESKQRHWRI